MDKLIDNLKKYTLEHQITQGALAEKLGVTRLTICRWLNGQSNPSALQEYRINKLITDRELFDTNTKTFVKETEIQYTGNKDTMDKLKKTKENIKTIKGKSKNKSREHTNEL
jgi:transcriptional regulator with XRE-family HTH domain